jgi:phosphatidylglycerophosphate synthase
MAGSRGVAVNSEFGARYDIEADALLVLTLTIILHHRGLAGAWVVMAGLWRYLYVLTPLLFPTPLGEARRSRHGRFAYVLMISCFMLTLLLPPGVGAPLALVGTLAVSMSFLHSFWERYNPIPST